MSSVDSFDFETSALCAWEEDGVRGDDCGTSKSDVAETVDSMNRSGYGLVIPCRQLRTWMLVIGLNVAEVDVPKFDEEGLFKMG